MVIPQEINYQHLVISKTDLHGAVLDAIISSIRATMSPGVVNAMPITAVI
jgi:hypothetical protein